jgi:hypothetical protein
MQLGRPWNRYDPGLLREEPGERDLGGRRLLALGDAAEQQVHQGPVRLPRLRREAGDGVPVVGAGKRRVLVHFPGEVAFPQRTEGDKPDAELFERRQDLGFRFPLIRNP